MYKNLIKELQKLGIQKNELLKPLNYDYQKKLSDRLIYNIEFNNEEKKRIFNYLKEKGYKGSQKDLFIFSKGEKKEKNKDNEFSKLLKQAMKKNKISNKELCDLLNEEGFSTSENTISLWRNGNVEKPRTEYIIPLSKVLNINPLKLLGDHNEIIEDFISEEYHQNKMEYKDLKESIYNLLIEYQLKIGYSHSDLETKLSFIKEAIEPQIEKFISDMNLSISGFIDSLGKIDNKEFINGQIVYKHYYSKAIEKLEEAEEKRNEINKKKQRGESTEKEEKELNNISNDTKELMDKAEKGYRHETHIEEEKGEE